MWTQTDGASSEDGTSYLDIVDFIKSYGANPKEDLVELWKRIVFNMAISVAVRFGITETDAGKIAAEILETVKKNWERLAKQYGLTRGQIEDMRPAFHACYEKC